MDRFVEIDCDVFGPPFSDEAIRAALTSLSPLWVDDDTDSSIRGLVINFGWLMDTVTVWSGDFNQRLPIDSSRLSAWGDLTYQDLADVISNIRQAVADLGLPPLRIGPMMLGIGEFRTEIVKPPHESSEEEHRGAIYQERSEWYSRHPELFPFPVSLTLHGPGIDFRVPLVADSHRYAAFPNGIPEATSFAEFFSAQWAELSHAVGFDLLHLRDEFTSPVHSGRISFSEDSNPATAAEISEWTDSLIGVLTSLKKRSPETFLMIYSTGLSPAVERAYARVDITRVAAESGVDAWIEQTWGGAWQDWWDAGMQGWTFQYTHLLSRLAQIREANRHRPSNPCRHYRLIQLLDGWEPYDTFHDYREKLRWGMWAFGHAAIDSDKGKPPERTAGCYFAFANDSRAELLTDEEIEWVANEIRTVEHSASAMTKTRGFSLEVGGSPKDQSAPPTVWTEEIAGFLMKFGLPISHAHLKPKDAGSHPRIDSTQSTSPETAVALLGGSEHLPASLALPFGIDVTDEKIPPGYRITYANEPDIRKTFWPHYPAHTVVRTEGNSILWSAESALAAKIGDSWWWLPPDIANPKDRRVPHYQIGALEPHIVLARRLLEHPQAAGMSRLLPVSAHHPLTLLCWDSLDAHHILLGNVESGWIGDSRYPRMATIALPENSERSFVPWALTDTGQHIEYTGNTLTVEIPAEGMLLLTVEWTDD